VTARTILHPCCAGLDVHTKTIFAGIRTVGLDGTVRSQVRKFGTMTGELLALADWLESQGVRQVARESTGVYWKPVFNLLEGRFEVILVNAPHIKTVPGRKADVKDSEWIAQLLPYGLLAASFIPEPPIRALRDLTRQRTQLVRDPAAVANRIQKVWEDANIKLSRVASDVLGASGRAMRRAIIDGLEEPAELAELARRRLRGKIPELAQALQGRITDHHRFLLRALREQIESLEGLIARFDARIEEAMVPLATAAGILRGVAGIGAKAAEVVVAELGVEMAALPTPGHLSSWAGLCPGNDQSAGKRRSGKTTKGSQWLGSPVVQAAWAARRTKGTIFAACYQRWAKRRGKKKALVAVAHKILVVIWHLLKKGTEYREKYAPAPAA
jgi:transposase